MFDNRSQQYDQDGYPVFVNVGGHPSGFVSPTHYDAWPCLVSSCFALLQKKNSTCASKRQHYLPFGCTQSRRNNIYVYCVTVMGISWEIVTHKIYEKRMTR